MTSSIRRFWHNCYIACAVVMGGWHPSFAVAAEPAWPKEPYRYLVVDQDLRDVLTEFGRNVRLTVRISDKVTRRRVRSEFAVLPPRDFLQRLCESYGLVWYYDGAILFISDESEIQTEQISTGSVDPDTLADELATLGGADPRFPIRPADSGALVAVSGPPPYRAFVRQTLQEMGRPRVTPPVQEIMNGD